ncbi:Putative ATPase, V1 complex, subunit C, vacuolar ATP synthase subunit C superfamily [Septoria linicola]|uniref:V-type proton ATPase subunit C n=1 Tax=Septoria linicola TaxID=215465 RepID=A0A9Q9ACZ8_9PEZI|nr:putative ATPase, V1 complex, subunit C, vacuolar ATP synthase subunit C superfamily [Septoria linicola]USW46850.1 Putative ATPase, V1 complex, subunit C, vacuolar ATP synthase subunit C superfamily [Septoria linicola]
MPPQTFFLVSLPNSVSPSDSRDEALTTLRSAVSPDHGTTYPFAIPEFKVGTLDALVQQADELAKLEQGCKGVVDKVADSLRSLLEGDEEKLQEQKVVNDKPVENYLQSFQWNKVKYRADKPIAELVDNLQKEIAAVDNDVKAKFTQYNQTKTNLASLQRSQTGNLSQKSLNAVVNPDTLLKPDQSEYLQQHLVAVPSQLIKDFLKTYESISPMVVPRSAQLLAKDDEFQLYVVTTFKKHASEFVHKCREHRWTPRDMKFNDGGRDAEEAELRKLEKEERKTWGEALRLGRTGYSDAVMGWIHVLTLRVFVETVLRYGLPLAYVCGLIKTTPKLSKKAKTSLDNRFADLGGNAVSRDKKGRPKQDDGAMQQELAGAGLGGDQGFEPYVFYEFEII